MKMVHDAANALLAGVLIGAWQPDDCGETEALPSEDQRLILTAMHELQRAGEEVGRATLRARLAQSAANVGADTLAAVFSATPMEAEAKAYVKILANHHRRMSLADVLGKYQQILRAGVGDTDDLIGECEAEIYGRFHGGKSIQVVEMRDAVDRVFKAIQARAERTDKTPWLPSGLSDLDNLVGGFRPGGLVVIGARPGEGKSALANNIMTHVTMRHTMEGKPCSVATFSLEMTEDEVVERSLASEGRVDGRRISDGNLREMDWSNLARARADLGMVRAQIIDSTDVSPADIRATSRSIAAECQRSGTPLRAVIVDYLQLLKGTDEHNREREVATLSRALKATAKELKIPVFALVAVGREVERRATPKPMMSDIRESGAIESDANTVIFLYRADVEKEPEVVNMYVPKNRGGKTGEVKAIFLRQYLRFVDAARSDQ